MDDYGHHPSEVAAVIQTARRVWPDRRLVMVYQPHRYTRMQDLVDELAGALQGADVLLVTDIYSAWEPEIPGVDSELLARAARGGGKREVHLVLESSEIVPALRQLTRPGDLLIFVGAGDIGRRAGEFLGEESAD